MISSEEMRRRVKEDLCIGCAGPLPPAALYGPPRQWCSTRCRKTGHMRRVRYMRKHPGQWSLWERAGGKEAV